MLARIAALLNRPLLESVDAENAADTAALLVASDTHKINDVNDAGISERGDIFGGCVPAMFVGTKAITHSLVDGDAARPAEWSFEMARLMGDAARLGYTAFSLADAAKAGRLLLAKGPIRIKNVCDKAGLGQEIVRNRAFAHQP